MAGICVCRVSAAIIATLHSTLLPLHSLVRYLTAADTYALLVDRKQIGLEVNADKKTKYKVMSGEKNAGRTHDIKNDNSSIQREEEFKDLVETLKNQNFIQEEITSKLNSGNACYHSVQNLLSSSLLSKN